MNKLNDYESLFKFCEVVHNFTLNVEQVYAKFSNWGTLGVAIICIVFVVLMIFIGLICLNKRWKSILLFLEWKNDRLKKAFEFETLKEKSLESNQQRIDN